jgi:hypothetical protein
MKRLPVSCLFLIPILALVAAWATATARADGVIITESVDPSSVMSDQKAVVAHRDGREELIISVGLALQPEQHREEWAWIIPVPAQPEVKATQPGIFAELDLISMPEIVWQAADEVEVEGALSQEVDKAVEVLERAQVGVLDVAVLSGDQAATLLDWLEAEGFGVPRSLAAPIDAYMAEGWTFVAMRISPYASDYEIQDAQPVWLSFNTPEMVYPMRLTGVYGNPLGLRLYILADHRTELDGFEVEFAGPAQLAPFDRDLAAALEGDWFFTKLYNPAVQPSEMAVDFYPRQAVTDEAFRQVEVRTYYDIDDDETGGELLLGLWPCGLCWVLLAFLLVLLLGVIYWLRRRE